jgi:type I restriction enzyme, R subunit
VHGETAVYGMSPAEALDAALKIDATVKEKRPDAWRGILAREQIIKAAVHKILPDISEVERIFLIIKQQGEY